MPNLYFLDGRPEDAVPGYERFTSLAPWHPKSQDYLFAAASIYSQDLDSLDQTIRVHEEILERDPTNAEAAYYLGRNYWDKALPADAPSIGEPFDEQRFGIAMAAIDQSLVRKSLGYFDSAIRENHCDALWYGANAAASLNEFEKALDYFTRYIRCGSDSELLAIAEAMSGVMRRQIARMHGDPDWPMRE